MSVLWEGQSRGTFLWHLVSVRTGYSLDNLFSMSLFGQFGNHLWGSGSKWSCQHLFQILLSHHSWSPELWSTLESRNTRWGDVWFIRSNTTIPCKPYKSGEFWSSYTYQHCGARSLTRQIHDRKKGIWTSWYQRSVSNLEGNHGKSTGKLPKGLPRPLGKMKITKPVQFIEQHCGCFLAIFHSHMKYIKRKIYVKKVCNQYQVADDISISDLTFMSMQLIKIAQISDMEHASTCKLVLKWYWKCVCFSETHGSFKLHINLKQDMSGTCILWEASGPALKEQTLNNQTSFWMSSFYTILYSGNGKIFQG